MRITWLLVVACSEPARPTPPQPVVAKPDPCATLATPHRVALKKGIETNISRDGRGLFKGSSVDHHADGTSATVLSLEVLGSPWLADERDREYHPFGAHCVRLVAVTADQLELDVALQSSHEYDDHRCHVSCCAPGASRAPDGSEECCFCSDKPR